MLAAAVFSAGVEAKSGDPPGANGPAGRGVTPGAYGTTDGAVTPGAYGPTGGPLFKRMSTC
ncbi:hypothetical protein GCM10010205_23480 [Streptomyces nojiriensis]|nr:hypothetical protein GCM10010205_23480 [Streptomyces nojiriensis]